MERTSENGAKSMNGRATAVLPAHRRDPEALLEELVELRETVWRESLQTLARWQPIERRAFRLSAPNLAAYLAFRRRDLRRLQIDLLPYGLSSFGRSEARVLTSIDAVIASLRAITGEASVYPHARAFFRGERLLRKNTRDIFGVPAGSRRTRIMVTFATEMAGDPALVEALIAAGMNCARINCAHDDVSVWRGMVANVRRAEERLALACKICFDLAGPKVRTALVRVPDPGHRVHGGDRILFAETLDKPSETFPVAFTSSFPKVLLQLRPGSAVWINDGRIGCVVDECSPGRAVLRVTRARPKGESLKPEKGLNFPDIALAADPLTEVDLVNLELVAPLADMIGYSFVREPRDVVELQDALAGLLPGAPPMPLELKIETALAVTNLPELIAASARRNPTTVMIARGDLAVEIEYRRLAEIQEEMLWICEAAHVPIIWATEVLDGFIKDGKPSRAEFTDAAASERADCVMLNKGPFIVEAVTVLDDVLQRMEAHQDKNMHLLRALKSWS